MDKISAAIVRGLTVETEERDRALHEELSKVCAIAGVLYVPCACPGEPALNDADYRQIGVRPLERLDILLDGKLRRNHAIVPLQLVQGGQASAVAPLTREQARMLAAFLLIASYEPVEGEEDQTS